MMIVDALHQLAERLQMEFASSPRSFNPRIEIKVADVYTWGRLTQTIEQEIQQKLSDAGVPEFLQDTSKVCMDPSIIKIIGIPVTITYDHQYKAG